MEGRFIDRLISRKRGRGGGRAQRLEIRSSWRVSMKQGRRIFTDFVPTHPPLCRPRIDQYFEKQPTNIPPVSCKLHCSKKKKKHPTAMDKKRGKRRREKRERPIEGGEKKWIMRRIEKCWSRWNSRLLSSFISPLSLSLDPFSFFHSSKTKRKRRGGGGKKEENEKKPRAMICSGPVTRFSSFRWIVRLSASLFRRQPHRSVIHPRQNLSPPSPSRFNTDRMELANKPREHIPLGFSS